MTNELTPEQLDALIVFAKTEGRKWKSRLNLAWMDGHYGSWHNEYACYLQQVRNQFGPSWLLKFKLPK